MKKKKRIRLILFTGFFILSGLLYAGVFYDDRDGTELIKSTSSSKKAETTAYFETFPPSFDSEDTDISVNINTADKASLMTLPMIGEKRAEAIIAYRKENGDFSAPSDIMKVSGIGEGIYERIKDRIRV